MKKERKYGGPDWKRAVLGVGVGYILMLVGTAAFAWLICNEIIGAEHMGLAAAAILVAGGFLGALCTGGGEGRYLRAGMTAAGLVMVLLVINLILCSGDWSGLLPGAAAVFGSAAAAVLIRGGRREKRRYRKYGNR